MRIKIHRRKSKRSVINLPLGRRYHRIEMRIPKLSLENELCEILQQHVREHEGAVDTLCRLIRERQLAFDVIALDRIRERR